MARWQAPGLPRGEEAALADNPSVGALPVDCVPDVQTPVVVLSAQMGAGKSLGADRHLQAAIDEMLTHPRVAEGDSDSCRAAYGGDGRMRWDRRPAAAGRNRFDVTAGAEP